MNKSLLAALNFIESYRASNATLEQASWRINEFKDMVWECKFGDTHTTIDFRKFLDDGLLLTDLKHNNLLKNIKHFLCLQTHPALTGSLVLSPKTSRFRIANTLHILDYFLLRSDKFLLSTHEFNNISYNDVSNLIWTLSSGSSIKSGIYEPEQNIFHFLQKVNITKDTRQKLEEKYPELFEIENNEELKLSRDQTLNARAWLKENNFYAQYDKNTEYRYKLVRMRLLNMAIGQNILCPLKFDNLTLPGLDVTQTRCFSQELPRVPVSDYEDDDRASIELAQEYIKVLRSMHIARTYDINLLPTESLVAVDDSEILFKERTKSRNRFTTLPFSLANSILGKSIAYFLEYGEPLVNYYLALARDGREMQQLSVPIPSKLLELGINQWHSKANKAEGFFSELRNGTNLYNMLEVLLGSVGILVNSLMARRSSELSELEADSIIEQNGSYFLAFDLRKANVLELRKRTLRPMPKIAAEALKLLAKLSNGLKEMGYSTGGKLFGIPYILSSNYGTGQPNLRRCFDRFCDYFEVDLDEHGRRYYVRAHQLRRNFAMLFFWHGSFGGVELLRYFLGHSNSSMTYRYVTEAISGKVLRRVKASVAKDLIKAEHTATEALANLICERYKLSLSELHILPETDVVDYIEDLLTSGAASVEPEFFIGPMGEEYRILYKVTQAIPALEG